MELDHVLIAVADLTASARKLEARHGLISIKGGRHPGWGTANTIVPLGNTYLELVAVVDEQAAAASVFGRWVARAHPDPGRPLGWAVHTNDLTPIARRLDLDIHEGMRTTPSGQRLRWRSAGIERAAATPLLPFFIEWDQRTAHPGRVAATHRTGPAAIAKLELAGDQDQLRLWLADHPLPVAVRAGKPDVVAIVLHAGPNEIVLNADNL